MKPKQVFSALDTPAAPAALVRAAGLCWRASLTKAAHRVRAYVLCRHQPDDRPDLAELRMRQVLAFGIIRIAMLYLGLTCTG